MELEIMLSDLCQTWEGTPLVSLMQKLDLKGKYGDECEEGTIREEQAGGGSREEGQDQYT
jgi:hypothetical protein